MNKCRPLYRPAGFSTLPDDLDWDYVEAPTGINRPDLPLSRHRYGIIITSRPQTDDERGHFGLEIEP